MKDDLKLDMDAYLPLRDVVFNTLRDAILKGDLAPGERLKEMHLANQLGVSRTPIREAIRMLEQEGLAVTIPRRGAQVAHMSQKDLEDVLEVRDALDELAVKNACHCMTKDDFVELDEAMEKFKDAVSLGDVRTIVETDEAFHNVIYHAANNSKLESIVMNLEEQMYRFRYEYIKENADYLNLVLEHEALIAGLKKKDEEYVTDVMHKHLVNQMRGVRNAILKQEKNNEM